MHRSIFYGIISKMLFDVHQRNFFPYHHNHNILDQGSANIGSQHLRLWVAKISNVDLRNNFDVMIFFASVFSSNCFLELFCFETF